MDDFPDNFITRTFSMFRSKSRGQIDRYEDSETSVTKSLRLKLIQRGKSRNSLSKRYSENSLVYDKLGCDHNSKKVNLPSFDVDDLIIPASEEEKTKQLFRDIDKMIITNYGYSFNSFFGDDSDNLSDDSNKENIPDNDIDLRVPKENKFHRKSRLPLVDLHKELEENRPRHYRVPMNGNSFISNNPYKRIIIETNTKNIR